MGVAETPQYRRRVAPEEDRRKEDEKTSGDLNSQEILGRLYQTPKDILPKVTVRRRILLYKL